jgi:hypothetical protein
MLNQGRFDGKGNGDSSYGDKIMATCVANTRKSIHFRINAEYAPSIPMRKSRYPSGIEKIMPFYGPSVLLHERSKNIMGIPLAVATRRLVTCM